jgi:hypothetical protein
MICDCFIKRAFVKADDSFDALEGGASTPDGSRHISVIPTSPHRAHDAAYLNLAIVTLATLLKMHFSGQGTNREPPDIECLQNN